MTIFYDSAPGPIHFLCWNHCCLKGCCRLCVYHYVRSSLLLVISCSRPLANYSFAALPILQHPHLPAVAVVVVVLFMTDCAKILKTLPTYNHSRSRDGLLLVPRSTFSRLCQLHLPHALSVDTGNLRILSLPQEPGHAFPLLSRLRALELSS